MKIPYEQSSDVDDVRGVVPAPPTAPAHVIPELDCNKVLKIKYIKSCQVEEITIT
jgi:hypothetical protein